MTQLTMDQRDLIATLQEYRKEHFLTLDDLAQQLEVSSTLLSQLMNFKYSGNTDEHIRRIYDWLMPKVRPDSLDVVRTETFESLLLYFDDAYKTQSIYCITGKSGFGKTVAGRFYEKTHLRAHWVSGRVNMGPKNLMEEIVRAAKIRVGKAQSVYALQNRIQEHFAARAALLIVDEADKLRTAALDAVRELYDAVPCGLVLIGEPALSNKLLTADRNGLSLDRLYSRIDEFVEVDEISRDDVSMFLKDFGISKIKSKEAFDYLVNSINKRGGYRRLQKISRRLTAAMAVGEHRDYVTKEELIDILSKFPA